MRRSDHTRLHNNSENYQNPWLGKFGDEHHSSISIVQLTKDGLFVKKWPAAMEVQRELGIYNSNIIRCCKGIQKSAGGFHWVYDRNYRRTISDIKPLF